MSKEYNQQKIDRFLKNDKIKYCFLEENNTLHFCFIENNVPISSINFSEYVDDDNFKYYPVGGSYSQSGLGKILYYIALMHMTSLGHHITCAEDGDIRGSTVNIWESIRRDSSVSKRKLNVDECEFEEDFFNTWCFQKEPDELFQQIISEKLIQSPNQAIFELSSDLFATIYDADYTSEEIDNMILIEKTSPLSQQFGQILDKKTQIFFDTTTNHFYLIQNNKIKASLLLENDIISDIKGDVNNACLLIEISTYLNAIRLPSNQRKNVKIHISSEDVGSYLSLKDKLAKTFFENIDFQEKITITIKNDEQIPFSAFLIENIKTENIRKELSNKAISAKKP